MMPTLLLTAGEAGVICINGRFAGELSPDAPLIRPSASHGALLLDFRPFSDEHRPMMRRLVFSGGAPLADSVEAAGGLSCVIWPGGVIEIELIPTLYQPPRQVFSREGFSFMLEGGSEPKLQCEGRHFCSLPEGAEIPELRRMQGGILLTGKCRNGMYLACADGRLERVNGFLKAKEIEIQPDGHIFSTVAPGDSVGHAAREEWQLTPNGLQLLSSEFAWEHGAPRWPRTPEDTAVAAVEAAMAGLEDEAEGYMLPRLRESNPLREIRERCDLCVRMKYAPPGDTACVGLLKLEGGSLARVEALCCRAAPSGRQDFPWLLEALEFA